MEQIVVGLIKGRHMMPVEEYIFDKAIDKVHDYKGIRNHIEDFLVNRVGIGRTYGVGVNQDDYTDVQLFCGKANLVVYVTGLTPVIVELVASCMRNGIHLTLMNYDTASGNYIPQPVL